MHRIALALIVTASALVVSTARADGDVPPDPVACPALYADLCVIPGACADVCGTLCDGDDTTDASLACKVCSQTGGTLIDWHTCYSVVYVPPTCQQLMPDTPACVGGEIESGCYGDGLCEDVAAPACYACDPGGGALCVTYCGADAVS